VLDFVAPDRADTAARRHLVVAVFFFVIAAFAFVVLTLKIPFPAFLENIPVWSYGRLRPAMLNAALWGWVTVGYVGVAYYVTPRLCGTPLWGERLANTNLWLSTVVYLAGVVAIASGVNQGRAMAEFPWWLDVLTFVTLTIPAVVITKTVARRTEDSLYVSLWYVLGGSWWIVGLYLVGNAPGAGGVSDLLQTSFFTAGVGGLWLVGMGIGAVYYLIPKITGSPLYSRAIALVGFWSLAFAQVWVGPAAWIWGPIPGWSQLISAVMLVALIVPAAAVIANFVGTLRPRWDMLAESIPLKFAMAGSVIYLVATVLAAFSAFWPMVSVTGFTLWSDGLLTALLFGVATLWIAAFSIHAVPRILGVRLFSHRLGDRQLRLTEIGILLVSGSWLLAGFYAGFAWIAGVQSGAYANTGPGFTRTTEPLQPFFLIAVIGAMLLFAAAVVYAYNLYRTITSGLPDIQELLEEIPASEGTAAPDADPEEATHE
jgi:cbb3-type cytochrome c oxidase subunit I